MPSLAIYKHKHQVHAINGPWLYPLLELEEWLAENPQDTASLNLYDKIIGRAGALLIHRLGFKAVRTDLISELAIDVFNAAGIAWQADEVTERILCATESLLENITDPEEAHALITERAAAARKLASNDAVLTLENVNVLRDSRHVLSAVDLTVKPGERVLITGENGAGKSTLLRAILGFLPLGGGRIRYRDADVGTPRWRTKRTEIAYVRQIQADRGMTLSAEEIVQVGSAASTTGRRARARRTREALNALGVSHLTRRPFSRMSGGERRRVALAQAFAQEPSLIVLDEPTAGLDDASRVNLLDHIERAATQRGISVLMVSHDPFHREMTGWTTYKLHGGRLSASNGASTSAGRE